MSWTYDAPAGVYRNHALSSNIRKEAVENTKFMPFFSAEDGYGKGKGDSLTITRMLQLDLASEIGELDRLPSGRPAIETKTVGIKQWGFKIPVTEYEKQLTHFDITSPLQQMLRDQITRTMDKMCADALKQTPLKYVPTSTGYNLDTDGSATGVSDRNLGIQDLRVLHDELSGNLKCPEFKNGKYIGILSTKAARGIKNDPEYKDWQAPTTSGPLMDGRLRDVEGFALYETNHFAALANLVGTSTTTGEAIFFGADAGRILRVMDPELRMGQPDELGLFRDIGWVGTINAFLVWERASLARAIHITSN